MDLSRLGHLHGKEIFKKGYQKIRGLVGKNREVTAASVMFNLLGDRGKQVVEVDASNTRGHTEGRHASDGGPSDRVCEHFELGIVLREEFFEKWVLR